MITQFDKAIAAVLAAILTSLLRKYLNMNMTPELQDALQIALVGLAVYLVPNKKAASEQPKN